MEILKDLGSQSPGIAFGLICLYFYTELVKTYLAERKEIIGTLNAERKEWTESLRLLNQQYADLLARVIESVSKAGAEDHALRGKINELMLKVETYMLEWKNRMGRTNVGGGND